MTQTTGNTVAERLKELRLENDMTVYAVADIIGVTAATVSRYESGQIEPRKSVIERYAQHFRVSPLWIIGISDDKYAIGEVEGLKIPILGTIAAGVPILAQEDVLGFTWVPADAGVHFALKVKGDSMINARIHPGDLVMIRSQHDVEHGEIAVVLVDGEATVKRVLKANGMLILHPENPSHKDLIYTKHDAKEIRILGKVKSVQFEVV